jgi:eukaryotic-like serine/threonine-protein kinase
MPADEKRHASVIVAPGSPGPSRARAVERARAAAAPFGASVEPMEDGTIVAILEGKGGARDQARQAARCALALRDVLEGAPLAVATARAESGPEGIKAEVVERALELLQDRMPPVDAGRRLRAIAIDATTAGLLDGRFDVAGDGAGLGLRGERSTADAEAPRTLLGRPTQFVGRERELATLEAAVRACAEDRVAAVALVTGRSGAGKSRLRRELVRRLREQDERIEIWTARGDPMSAGSPLGMLAQVVRDVAGVVDGETLRTRQAKLVARVGRHVPSADQGRVAEFLGELAGIRFQEARRPQLRAARRSPVLMGDQMRRAWQDLLAAESAAQPVVLVLEDLHWGDVPTVGFVDGALRNLRDQPLMVLALAQPEVHRLFPQIWAAHPMTELRLGELPRKACERLVRLVMPADVADGTVARIVEHAAGNAFYLEELIRSVAEGREELPSTVLAMVEARLSSLDPDARRVLRAASVFGATFWRAGVVALVDGALTERAVEVQLEELAQRELVTARARGRFPAELVFRHAIVREAAYGMLTEADRTQGHRLAAGWLESAGEVDAMALAEHFERGGEPGRAVSWFERASTQALGGNDFATTIERAGRGMACGAQGEQRGALLLLRAEAYQWRGDFDEAEVGLCESLPLLVAGTARWYQAASELVAARVRLGRPADMEALVGSLADQPPVAGAESARVVAWARAAVALVFARLDALAVRLFDRIDGVDVDPADRMLAGRVEQARATRAIGAGDVSTYLEHAIVSASALDAAGDVRAACLQRSNVGYAQAMLGAWPEAEATLREALVTAERMGLTSAAGIARQNLGLVLANRGALQEARAVEERGIEATTVSGETLMTAFAYAYLAEILRLGRNFDAAERAARDAVATVGARVHEAQALAHATLARVLLGSGRVAEALEASAVAFELREAAAVGGSAAVVWLARAEALHASGDVPAARETIGEARDRLLARADRIASRELRRSFLECVPDNARTLRLAREWGAAAVT